MKKLVPGDLKRTCDPQMFPFENTSEIGRKLVSIGQDRLQASLEFGVGIRNDGYHIFALGPEKMNKLDHVRDFLTRRAKGGEVPNDLCYVYDFDDPYRPKLMQLPAGRGGDLARQMEQVVDEMIPTLRSSYESEEYQRRTEAIKNEAEGEQGEIFEAIRKEAKKKGLMLLSTPVGFTIVPMKEDGELMEEQDIENLSEKEFARLEKATEDLQKELQQIIRKIPATKRWLRDEQKKLNEEIARYSMQELLKGVRADFADLEEVIAFLDSVEKDLIQHIDRVMTGGGAGGPGGGSAQAMMMAMAAGGGGGMSGGGGLGGPGGGGIQDLILERYKVNLIVDHGETEGAPVVYEDNPHYKNLNGRVEYQSDMGTLTTHFGLIKPGAFHKAHGGYLILDARQVLLEPFAWESLKRTLKSKELKMEALNESYSLISTVSLEPEPLKLDVKVVLFGHRRLYYLLCELDPDFKTLFKVEADFEDEVDWTEDVHGDYASLLAGLIEKKELMPFDRTAVARVFDEGARMAGDREKLSTMADELADLLMESHHWAQERGAQVVAREDVQQALDQKVYRSARLRDRLQEGIVRELVYIDTEGAVTGQINGLSVLDTGNLRFGKPSRITATVEMGKGDIVDIEREVQMGGPYHSKGMMILQGFIGSRYAQDQPLSLNARIVFEQSYGLIDGDSASSTEIYVLLSAIGEIPLRQSFAVTGSVNQHGVIQPIGGVNEKIEGFFDLCQARGLTGEQGVIIPFSNEKHLMLRDDVIAAVERGEFQICSVRTVDEGMELLTGLPMGELDSDGAYPAESVNGRVKARLEEFARRRKRFIARPNGEVDVAGGGGDGAEQESHQPEQKKGANHE